MPGQAQDPYAVLGVSRDVSDTELRAAYRRLVKRHHPDHNGGSEESERAFEAVQDAYARVRELRAAGSGGPAGPRGGARPRSGSGSGTRPGSRSGDGSDVDARLAEMERELREAKQAREQAERARDEAVRAARRAAAAGDRRRASDEELGYISTDDSLSKILADARDAIGGRLDDARESRPVKRLEDLLDELADKLKGPPADS